MNHTHTNQMTLFIGRVVIIRSGGALTAPPEPPASLLGTDEDVIITDESGNEIEINP